MNSPSSATQSCQPDPFTELAISTFKAQAAAIQGLVALLDDNFGKAVRLIRATQGHVVISGMGKSGIIGKKMAATFASTGTPSFFMHPAEAFHGDLGMITGDDLVILISYSGETEEVIRLIPSLKQRQVSTICLVGKPDSTLGRNTDAVLNIAVEREVCPNNLAPTNSTLTTLAMGDALAVALIKDRNFLPLDFARFHPGGSLGRRLLTRVRDVMHDKDLPLINPASSMMETISAMTQGRLGLAIVAEGKQLLGIITDGDLRRALGTRENAMQMRAGDFMTRQPLTISADSLLVEAEQQMMQAKVNSLIVTDPQHGITGVLQIFDLQA